jgi:predicted P-loop ATPase
LVASEHKFHPLRERLLRLAASWDQTARLDTWLIRFLGAEDNDYHKEIAFRFPISMVARIFQPGCKVDHMMVLEGPQGILKSKVIKTMALGYVSDTLPDLDSDAIRLSAHLRGKWLIEVSELASISKAEASRLKAFLTTEIEQYIPKFGRMEVREPRQCCFIGTINEDTYLKDETGNRRFWPVKCGTIDLDGLEAEWEQVLGEAVREYRNGTPWWVDRDFEAAHFRPQQDARLWSDAWEQRVKDYLDGHYTATGAITPYKQSVSILSVAEECIGIEARRFSVPEQKRVAAILRHLGWEFKRTMTGRLWIRP